MQTHVMLVGTPKGNILKSGFTHNPGRCIWTFIEDLGINLNPFMIDQVEEMGDTIYHSFTEGFNVFILDTYGSN